MLNEPDGESVSDRRGIMLVVSSPSGAGKTTLCRRLLEEATDLKMSVSATTRAIRPGEEEGVHYQFLDTSEFESMISEDAFLEYARVFEHYYGTPRGDIEASLRLGKDVIFDVDWQGARALKQVLPGDVVSVFILPPSITELERRLSGRPRATSDSVKKRLAGAARDIQRWGEYDYIVVNDDLDKAYEQLKSVLVTERLKRSVPSLGARVDELLEKAGK